MQAESTIDLTTVERWGKNSILDFIGLDYK